MGEPSPFNPLGGLEDQPRRVEMPDFDYLRDNNAPPSFIINQAADYDFSKLSDNEFKQLTELLELQAADGLDNIHLYAWQRRFIAATSIYTQCLLMAANRVGKTYTGCYIDAIHATGRYPDDWEGHRFTEAPLIWVLGYSGEKCRDILQSAIVGAYSNGECTGALIPKEAILDAVGGAVARMCSQVSVEWTGPNGEKGISVIQFKSYSQGQHALMGDGIDWYHIDEEPKDETIWPQVLTRTATGGTTYDDGTHEGGRGILTFTPENGLTQLVKQFMDDIGPGQYLQRATWDDAPHLSDSIKESLLAAFPAHQRDMRSKGEPLMGSGLIYDFIEADIVVEPFQIPEYWFVINGMDFGWDHPQSQIQMVWNRDADIFYLVNAWKASKTQPHEAWHIVSPWAEGVPTAWPHDGLQTEKGSAKQQKSYYDEAGFTMIYEHATWEDGGNGVWAGIMEINNLLKTGRLKVFANLHGLLEEMRQYHTRTDAHGKSHIVKAGDDLVDALRYAYMMRRHAIRICDLNPDAYQEMAHQPTQGYTGD